MLGDVNDVDLVREVIGGVDAVVHAAAESHVDRSIDETRAFLQSNLMGTQSVLEAVRAAGVRMLMISTDEVYGSGDPGGGLFAEDAPIAPRSPVRVEQGGRRPALHGVPHDARRRRHGRARHQCVRAAPDRARVPTYTICALEGQPLPVYGRGEERREFLHVRDWAAAALTVLERGEPGVLYNIGGGTELSNLELAERIAELVGVSEDLIAFVTDRPGHDFRYGVTAERVKALGWSPAVGFDEGLADTVAWYRDHREWLYRAHNVDVVTRPRPPQGVA